MALPIKWRQKQDFVSIWDCDERRQQKKQTKLLWKWIVGLIVRNVFLFSLKFHNYHFWALKLFRLKWCFLGKFQINTDPVMQYNHFLGFIHTHVIRQENVCTNYISADCIYEYLHCKVIMLQKNHNVVCKQLLVDIRKIISDARSIQYYKMVIVPEFPTNAYMQKKQPVSLLVRLEQLHSCFDVAP